MEEALVVCYYSFFCCLLSQGPPISSEPPKEIENPALSDRIKGALDKIAS